MTKKELKDKLKMCFNQNELIFINKAITNYVAVEVDENVCAQCGHDISKCERYCDSCGQAFKRIPSSAKKSDT